MKAFGAADSSGRKYIVQIAEPPSGSADPEGGSAICTMYFLPEESAAPKAFILFSNKTIKKSFYHSRQHREWQIILICRKRYGTTDSPGPCPGLHPQIGMQHKNVFKHFYGILVSAWAVWFSPVSKNTCTHGYAS